MQYQNKQPATVLLFVIGIIICGIILLSWDSPSNVLWPPVVILSVVAYLFHSLTIKVTENDISWYFGPGFWKKSIPIQLISEVRNKPTKWYYGLGIRYLGTGWLYTVSGTQAIELSLKDGTKIYLGTNEPNHLMTTIESKIGS